MDEFLLPPTKLAKAPRLDMSRANAFGPGAPVHVGVGALIGSIAFAVGLDLTFD
jgi:hypothetical protein